VAHYASAQLAAPLPAAFWMLLTALGAFSVVSRRRNTQTA
jgi:hypothetical protein